MQLKVKKLSSSATLPNYAHPGDAGLDLYAAEPCTILPGRPALVPTGIAIELPPNTEGQVRPRSGLAFKHQVTVLNAPGTIDEGYRGELKVLLINHGREEFHIEPGMRIAQLVVQPTLRIDVVEVGDMSESRRDVGGFGSTGR